MTKSNSQVKTKTVISSSSGYKKTSLGLIPNDWDVQSVGQAFNICNNLRLPISEEIRKNMKGPYPYFGPTKIQDCINEYKIDGKYALIGEDGDHFLKWRELSMTQLVEGKFNVNNHAHLIQGKEQSITEWFYYYFQNRELTAHLTRQGAGRYKLTKDALSKIPIALPTLKEQHEIVKILSAWDEAITITQQLIKQLKRRNKGLMQELLRGKTSHMHLRLGDFLPESSNPVGKNDIGYEVLSVTKNGLVSQKDYFKKVIASEDRSKYKIVVKGDIVMSGLNFWMGAIDMVTEFNSGIISPAYKVYKPNMKYVDANYFKHYVRSNYMSKILLSCSITGASIVRRNFDKEMFENWTLTLPPLKEQKQASLLLDIIEKETKLNKQKLDFLIFQKNGLMQKLLKGEIRVKVK